jgi:hypothetical protein
LTQGSTRREVLWTGPPQECPSNAADLCTETYDKGESRAYHKAINLMGGLYPSGGPSFPVPFPLFTVGGPINDVTNTTSWSVSNSVKIKPGQRATPVLAVDYQEWTGDYLGAYLHDGEDGNCHRYHLNPNQEFGHWHGEVATKDYSTWDIQ